MTVSAEVVELQKNGVAAGVPVDCAMQCYDPTWVELYYGTSKVKAVYNTDYTVSLAVDYLSFTFTPTASLITKITNLGEGNVTFVVRKPDRIQDFDTTDAFIRQRIVDMIDKAYMNLQWFNWYVTGVVAELGSPVWGDLGGTLSNQTDLQAALDAKVSTAVLTESVQDIVGAFLSGTGISVTYNDVGNTVTLAIIDGAVATAKIADGAVTTAKIADDAIDAAKIANGAVGTSELADGSVATAKIADVNVTTAKLADGSVTTAKIADDAINAAKIANGAVGTTELADGSVTNAKIADLATLKAGLSIGTGDVAGLAEFVQDEAANLLDDGTYISWSYNDVGNSLVANLTAAVLARLMPAGGTIGQALVKNTNSDYDASWGTVAGGGGGSGDMTKAVYDTDSDGIVDAAESAPWAGLTGVPATFPPSAHSHVAANVSDFAEAVDDRVAALLSAGSNIGLSYNDAINQLVISYTGAAAAWGSITGTLSAQTDLQTALDGKSATGHTHVAANVTDFAEAVDDRVNALFVAGTNITFSYNDAAGTFTVNASGGGQYVAQITETANSTASSFAAVALIPEDATIPQNTEGVQLMTHTHTPLKAGNKLLVECDISVANDSYFGMLLALFRDSVADALMVGTATNGGATGDGGRGHISFIYTAPDTTPVTFKVRAAPTWTTSTIYFNRPVAGAYYGGVERSAIRVTEYDPSASFTGTDKMPTGTYGDIYVPTAGVMNVQLSDNAPSTPPANTVRLFRQKVGGRNMLAVRGPSGLDTVMQPHMARNKVAWWNPAGNTATAPPVVGFNAPTALGTATIRSVATTNMATRAKRMGYVSAATAGSLSGHQNVSATSQFTVGNGSGLGGWHSVTRFCVSDAAAVAGARMFIGVRNAVAAPTNVEPDTLTQCVGVAAISSSNNLHIVYGGTAAQTKIDLGANFPANSLSADLYELSLFSSPYSGDVYWQVTRLNTGDTASGQIVNSGAAVLPTASLLLGVVAWRCNNATALAVGLDLAMHYVETAN